VDCDVNIASGVLDLVRSVGRGLSLAVDDVSLQSSAASLSCTSISLELSYCVCRIIILIIIITMCILLFNLRNESMTCSLQSNTLSVKSLFDCRPYFTSSVFMLSD